MNGGHLRPGGQYIGGATRLTGLIGWPVAHSLSPAMHNAAAADLGLDMVYMPLAVHPDNLKAAVKGLPALGFLGANVTVPHKEAIIPFLDEIDPAAAAIGAVNTIVVREQESSAQDRLPEPPPAYADPRLVGFNTDWRGFLSDLASKGVEIAGRYCLILGAGGSARAVAYGLASAGGRVQLFARRIEQAQRVTNDLGARHKGLHLVARPWAALHEADGSLIVNTTPLGMMPNESRSPWPEGVPFPRDAFVYDLVYNPRETKLISQAKSAGLKASGGLGMLLRQGAASFEMWTGREPDLNIMAEALGTR